MDMDCKVSSRCHRGKQKRQTTRPGPGVSMKPGEEREHSCPPCGFWARKADRNVGAPAVLTGHISALRERRIVRFSDFGFRISHSRRLDTTCCANTLPPAIQTVLTEHTLHPAASTARVIDGPWDMIQPFLVS